MIDLSSDQAQKDLLNRQYSLRFNALRNALYHTSRRSHFDLMSRAINFLIIMAGTSSVAGLVASYSLQPVSGAFIAGLGAAQLVFDFSRRSADHQILSRDYWGIIAALEAEPNPSPKSVADLDAKMALLSGTEEASYRAVDAQAYNHALRAQGDHKGDSLLHVPFLHKIFGQYFRFAGPDYQTIRERKSAHSRKK